MSGNRDPRDVCSVIRWSWPTTSKSRGASPFETPLGSDFAIREPAKARNAGFNTELHYLAPNDVAINIERVRMRAYEGGHSAPEWKLRGNS